MYKDYFFIVKDSHLRGTPLPPVSTYYGIFHHFMVITPN